MARIRSSLLVGVAVCAFLLAMAGSALAAPVWRLTSTANTTVAPGGTLNYYLAIQNVGDDPASGQVEVTAELPEGMTGAGAIDSDEMFTCTGEGTRQVICTSQPGISFPNSVRTPEQDTLKLTVNVAPEASGVLTTAFQLGGAGGATVSTVDPTTISPVAPLFGIDAFDVQAAADPLGSPFAQAGGHPYDLTTHIDFNTAHNNSISKGDLWPVVPPKDTVVDLPPGFVGNPSVLTRCTARQLANAYAFVPYPECPPSSQVGVVQITRSAGSLSPAFSNKIAGPYALYNMVPPPGVPARFGFAINGSSIVLDAKVRSNGDYGLSVISRGISEAAPIAGVMVTFWGVPADPVHDAERGCPGQHEIIERGPSCPAGVAQQAFFRYPTSCTAAGTGLTYMLHTDSWSDPAAFTNEGMPNLSAPAWVNSAPIRSHLAPGYPYPPGMWGAPQGSTGCEKVPFGPSIEVQPTSHAPDSPSGLRVTLSIPQEALADPSQIAQADLKKAVVRLPEGISVNPASAAGLVGCSSAQIDLSSMDDPACPQESDIGTVRIETPLLREPLEGAVYLAAQDDNPFHSLLAIYIVAKSEGVLVKLPGHIEADPASGRLTTTFDNQPQLPFSKLVMTLKEGAHAPLLTASRCGSETASSTLDGWNGKTANLSNSYEVECPVGLGGFGPSFIAGTVSNNAGSFSPFALSFSRNDSEQRVSGLSFTMPPGASAKLAGVGQCSEAEIAAGKCSDASRIGSVSVASGGGPDPYFLKGSVYLTGPYKGGPFGDVVIVPAIAGPFNLGNVVVRGSIHIDPHTAQPTVVSDPFPQFVGATGIPTDIRRVDVNLDRPGFTFNPTNCSELKVTGTLTGAQGAAANVSSRFQASACRALAFKPSLTATVNARHSRRNGDALHVVVRSGAGQANIRYVHVTLPGILPSRLETLNKACVDTVFEANPAACPAASRVGTATARTPLLASQLTGPVYFVSHGGAKFPDLVAVLQGEGVTIDLVGQTAIKHNVTSSTFPSVPDVPVTRFDMTLPAGQYSALTALGNLCKERKRLVMPTVIRGQNGALIQRRTKVAVSGCAKAGAHNGYKHGKRK